MPSSAAIVLEMLVRPVNKPPPVLRLCAKQLLREKHTIFPLTQPKWSVDTLLRKPDNINQHHDLDRDLSQREIKHLHDLSGLCMPDSVETPKEFAKVSADVNRLRDFLSHIRVVSKSEDLSTVQPLVRISEAVEFTANEPNGNLISTDDINLRDGRKALQMAEQSSGPYFIVED
ncbi:hypothetical protein COEREDRAFT_85123 [Coemansia reversa NRRL 1564]|uniref:Uncharacterized protein n=1 Tax=Coemansia reversa (strain ATCC 12441 / NRRL 1564) TaxID=763665 RepID=A0A2G5BI42_COERN|nr:hypothetical protein COEREDRAFT_85123 [Coemansia reversa NRRL 1564]|eukprot:PIA18665.1 hypothetical protein COEREDRAFT_85123 [Coemansia reversa NRRL 1564]